MTATEAIDRMKAPADKRGDGCYGVMQIAITSHCDGPRCSNCTQMVAYGERAHMTLDHARRAIDSVAEYPGVVGIFGGNPCLHPEFRAISEHLAATVPDARRRGLWTNNLAGHGDSARACYGYYNFNVHGNAEWAAEMEAARTGATIWGTPDRPDGGHSRHGAVTVAMRDVVPDAADRWDMIARCDVNQRWSPAIIEINGELCAYFCEVAAAWARVRGDASAARRVCDDWWRAPMPEWADQVMAACPGCGVPLRMAGRMDHDRTDDVSESTAPLAMAAGRRAVVHASADGAATVRELTDYQKLRG